MEIFVTGMSHVSKRYLIQPHNINGQNNNKTTSFIVFFSFFCQKTYRKFKTPVGILVFRMLVQFPPPLWILKWGGLKNSGQRLISFNGKTKRTVFKNRSEKKKIKKNKAIL